MAQADSPMHVLFLIRSLELGGAERQLVELAKRMNRRRFTVTVGVFYGGGPLASELLAAGISVISLDKGGRWDLVPLIARLVRLIAERGVDVIHSYGGTSNLLAVPAALLSRRPLVWGVRSSYLDLGRYDVASRLSYWAMTRLSPIPDLIVFNSQSGLEFHREIGYRNPSMCVVPNGIDVQRFRPDEIARRRIREQWAIGPDRPVVGLVGRMENSKGHRTFLQAAAIVAGSHPNMHYVCVGKRDPGLELELQALARAGNIADRVRFEGVRTDMSAVYNALDILVSASHGEGFSNVIGEAMATDVPCVVSDVGDSAWVIGDTGYVVPVSAPEALADALMRCVAERLEGKASQASPRRRVEREFRTELLVERTEALLLETVAGHTAA